MGTLYLVTTICSVWLSGGTEECHSLEPFGAICALVTEENLECSPSFGISPTIKEAAGVDMWARWVYYSAHVCDKLIMSTQVIACRLTREEVALLDVIAVRMGVSRAAVMQAILQDRIKEEFDGADRGHLRAGAS
jgi:hypothetical protein